MAKNCVNKESKRDKDKIGIKRPKLAKKKLSKDLPKKGLRVNDNVT